MDVVELTLSVTQISKARDCLRLWWWEYDQKRKPPRTTALDVGVTVAEFIEKYLRGEMSRGDLVERSAFPEGTYEPAAAKLVLAGLGILPAPLPESKILVEHKFVVPFLEHVVGQTIYRVSLIGFIDLVSLERPDVAHIIDNKTPKMTRWAKREKDLIEDFQLNTYAWAMLQTGVFQTTQQVWLAHNNFVKVEPIAPYAVTVSTSWQKVFEVVGEMQEITRSMLTARGTADQTLVPFDVDACGNYGGCPHRTYCKTSNGGTATSLFESFTAFSGAASTPQPASPFAAIERIPAQTDTDQPPEINMDSNDLLARIGIRPQAAQTPPAAIPFAGIPQQAVQTPPAAIPFAGIPQQAVQTPPAAIPLAVLQQVAQTPPAANPPAAGVFSQTVPTPSVFSGVLPPEAELSLPQALQPPAADAYRPIPPVTKDDRKLDDIPGLPARLVSSLAKINVVWVSQLLAMTDAQLRAVHGLGDTTLDKARGIMDHLRATHGIGTLEAPAIGGDPTVVQGNDFPRILPTPRDVEDQKTHLATGAGDNTAGKLGVLYVDCTPLGVAVPTLEEICVSIVTQHPFVQDGVVTDFRCAPYNQGYLHISKYLPEAVAGLPGLLASSTSFAYRALVLDLAALAERRVVAVRL